MKTFDEAVSSLLDNKERALEDLDKTETDRVAKNPRMMQVVHTFNTVTMLQTVLGGDPSVAMNQALMGAIEIGILIGKEMYQEDLERMMK